MKISQLTGHVQHRGTATSGPAAAAAAGAETKSMQRSSAAANSSYLAGPISAITLLRSPVPAYLSLSLHAPQHHYSSPLGRIFFRCRCVPAARTDTRGNNLRSSPAPRWLVHISLSCDRRRAADASRRSRTDLFDVENDSAVTSPAVVDRSKFNTRVCPYL